MPARTGRRVIGWRAIGVSIVWAWQKSVAEYVAAGQDVVAPVPAWSELPASAREVERLLAVVRYPRDQRRIWIRLVAGWSLPVKLNWR